MLTNPRKYLFQKPVEGEQPAVLLAQWRCFWMAMNNIGMPSDVGQIKEDVDGARLPAFPPDPTNFAQPPKIAKKGGKQGAGIIKRVRSMKGVGILANRSAKDRGQVLCASHGGDHWGCSYWRYVLDRPERQPPSRR